MTNKLQTVAFLLMTFVPIPVSSLFAQDENRDPAVELVQPGVTLSLVAEHPDLATPTGVDVDSEGRIWAVATHTHFRPDDYVGPEHDEVLVFSDKDGDGRAESRSVFYNATDATMDLELGPDGWVYLAERDRILRVKDTDGDGRGDVEQNIAQLKTEADYPHNGLEGLTWHPDGDLVFGIGENFAKPWTLTGSDGAVVSGTGEGGIFRCSPDGKTLRRIALGFWNPFGICVRDDGEIFAAENDPGERPPCRLLHVIEGGDYGYQRSFGPEAHHPFVAWNGELRGTLPMIHPSGEAPCGVLPLGRGLIVPSWSDHRVDFFKLKPNGASFSAERIKLIQGSRYFRPSCIADSPSNSSRNERTRVWYMTDWVDGRYQAHGYGRLWKLEIDLDQAPWVGPLELEPPTDAANIAKELRDGSAAPLDRLFELARDRDPFLARSALLALARQADRWDRDTVSKWSSEDRPQAVLALKLSGRPVQDWASALLEDNNPAVQFETLRWIADRNAKSLLPAIESYLGRSDLDYQRFEAAIATRNTLAGTPEAGTRHTETLLARVQDGRSQPKLRAFALRLLPAQPRSAPKDGGPPTRNFPKGLTLKLLRELLAVDDETLSLEVVQALSGNPGTSQDLLREIAADAERGTRLRTEAVAGLAAVAEQHVALLLELASTSEDALRDESIRALRSVDLAADQIDHLKEIAKHHPESNDLVQSVIDPKSAGEGRPDATDIDGWLTALQSVESAPDIEAGRRLFHHARITQCSNCHRHNGRGNVVGPDLSRLGANRPSDKRRWIVESILQPSLEMAPEYQPRTVLLKDGQIFTGIRLRSSTREAMRDTNGQNRTFDRNDIESMVESKTSFMPDGAVDALTIREFRDLIAFLENGS